MKNRASSFELRASTQTEATNVLRLAARSSQLAAGFTLIETLVAISLLTIAIVAPMSLTSRSLSAAYYARDQITAFHLAQEAIESVRHVRDHNILQNAFGVQADLLAGIPAIDGSPFTVNTLDDQMDAGVCNTASYPDTCPPLQNDPTGTFYGYGPGWADTRFTRVVRAQFVPGSSDEVRISVKVEWKTGSYQSRSVEIKENLYRWVNDGSAGS